MANQEKVKYLKEPMRTQSKKKKKRKQCKGGENTGDQIVISFSFVSDRLKEWHEYFRPITEQIKAKAKQSAFLLTLNSKWFYQQSLC